MKVVDGLEAVQIDQAQCERLAGLRSGSYSIGEQALKQRRLGSPVRLSLSCTINRFNIKHLRQMNRA